jgi:hypothetical protein
MRTTIELPDELMTRAKVQAATERVTLRELFISALEKRLASPEKKKTRREPPVLDFPGFREPTREEIAEAAFPIQHIIDEIERNRR